MNLAELNYSLLLLKEKATVDFIMNKLNIEILKIDPDIAVKSALFRFENKKLKLSYIDCLGYSLAIENNLKLLTGDKGFKNMGNVKFVTKI
jgi:PIN domain nuclease of toxin-antitoxin system